MGTTYVNVTVRNPANRVRSWTGKFRVNLESFDSLVPRPLLEAIGLQPRRHREYMSADGSKIAFAITTAELEFEGEIVGGTILYGDEDAEPWLGKAALESAGFEIDRDSETLTRLPAVLLKVLARHTGVSSL